MIWIRYLVESSPLQKGQQLASAIPSSGKDGLFWGTGLLAPFNSSADAFRRDLQDMIIVSMWAAHFHSSIHVIFLSSVYCPTFSRSPPPEPVISSPSSWSVCLVGSLSHSVTQASGSTSLLMCSLYPTPPLHFLPVHDSSPDLAIFQGLWGSGLSYYHISLLLVHTPPQEKCSYHIQDSNNRAWWCLLQDCFQTTN